MRNNKFAAVGAFVLALTLTTCSSNPASAYPLQLNTETIESPNEVTLMDLLTSNNKPNGVIAEQAWIVEAEIQKAKAEQVILDKNSAKMDKAISKLKKHIGSQYGYGDTPGYWDCSGLVRWFYLQQGIDLYHSASAEANAGKKVKSPKIGDIVAFHYGSPKWSFHVGIYVGDGKVLHAYNPYRDTVVQDIEEVERENNAWASYTRIVKTN